MASQTEPINIIDTVQEHPEVKPTGEWLSEFTNTTAYVAGVQVLTAVGHTLGEIGSFAVNTLSASASASTDSASVSDVATLADAAVDETTTRGVKSKLRKQQTKRK